MGKWNDFLVANNLSSNSLTKNSIICSCHFDSSNFILKSYNYQNKAINKLFIQTKVLSHFMNNNSIFSSLKNHSIDSTSSLSDHLTHLIKSISSTYMSLKIKYSIKSHNETPSLRMWYNKLTLFKGQ